MAQKYTQVSFNSFYNMMKKDNYGDTTPCYDVKGNLTAFNIKVKKSLITISVNGRISVEQSGVLKESGRYYGKQMVSTVKEIANCYNFC